MRHSAIAAMSHHEHQHLKIGIKFLSLVGFWPKKIKNVYLSFLYSLLFKLTLSIYIILVLTQFVQLHEMILRKELEEMTDLMATNLLYTLGLVKVWVIGGKTVQKLARKIYHTEQGILHSNETEVKRIYMEYVRKSHRANRVMIFLAFTCYILFCLTPVVTQIINPPGAYFYYLITDDDDGEKNNTKVYLERPLPLKGWTPFDKYKYYKTSFIWNLIAISSLSPYILACNIFFYSLIIFAVGQLKILQYNLKQLENEGDEVLALRKIIVYHSSIIIYIQELSEAMRMFLFLDCMACALQFAVIGFQAAVTDVSLQLLKTLVYLATMLTQLFLFYWYGNEILVESLNVSTCIWQTKWYLYRKTTKGMLLIVTMRAQRPLTLSIGPFYRVSINTMMMIVRAGYSYAALMRRLYS